jgi:superfamily II DNA or RNA helicase
MTGSTNSSPGQLGPVRHTITNDTTRDITSKGQNSLIDAWETRAGPRRVVHLHETEFRADDINPSSPDALAALHRALAADEARNTQIITDVTAALARGRNCLVLTRRVAHLEFLASLLASRGYQALVPQGGMSTTDRRAAINHLTEAKAGDGVLVIGTTPFIGEGFDAPALDTLLAHVHAFGDLNLRQSEALAHLGQSVGPTDVDESLRTDLDLRGMR